MSRSPTLLLLSETFEINVAAILNRMKSCWLLKSQILHANWITEKNSDFIQHVVLSDIG